MFSFLTNRISVLTILLVLLFLSSFSNDYGTTYNQGNIENYDLSHIAVSDDDNISDLPENNEDEPEQNDLINEPGLSNTKIELLAPGFLPIGEPLNINAALIGNEEGLDCLLTWYVNDEIIRDIWIVTGTEIPGFTHKIEYSRLMDESIDIKVSLQYTTKLNEQHKIEAEKTITIENYSIEHWREAEAPRVLRMVTSRYNGDFTLKWAEENDYDDFEKEVFVNANGYTSRTEYLLWVNRCYQRVNVFKGTGNAGEWEIYKDFIVSTGGWVNSTPRGVTTIPSRIAEGWVFIEHGYRVEPVVRFWPERSSPEGSSFAFHSRPLDIQTREVTDTRIGVPASSGCIRMYCDDAWWIFENIPDHTTVVVY